MKNKFRNICYKFILSILFVFVCYVTYCSIFNIYKPTEELKPFIIIIGVITSFFLIITIKRVVDKLSEKVVNILAIIICMIFFICLNIYGYYMTSVPSYDLSNIIKEAHIMLENGGKVTDRYFQAYYNQNPLLIYIFNIFRLGKFLGFNDLKIFAILFNSFGITITSLFTFLSVKKIKDYKAALITLVFFVLNPIFYLYSSYFYTDVLCMPFASIAIYLFLTAIQSKKMKNLIILMILCGIVLGIGFKIRVVVGFLLIGMVIDIFINNKICIKRAVSTLSIIAGFIFVLLIYIPIANNYSVQRDENIELPATHWILMGINREADGGFSVNDYTFSDSFETGIDKKTAIRDKINNRYYIMGIDGWIQLSKLKISRVWSNGEYDFKSKLETVERMNDLYDYTVGNKKIILLYYLQICKAFVILMLLASIIKEIRMTSSKCKFIFIALFGSFLFYIIWEASTRYSLSFLPWIFLLFSTGIEYTEKCLKNLIDNFITVEYRKVIRNTGIIVILCTIILGVINFGKYTMRLNIYEDKVAIQMKSNENGIEKIADKKIEQTFIAKKDFNSIAVRFLKNGTKGITNYNLEIYNSKNELIVKRKFNSNQVTNGLLTRFYFENVVPNKKTRYKIKIYSDDATNENSIGLATYNGFGYYDIYKDGKLKINGKEKEEDMSFFVFKNNVRTYFPTEYYIIMMIIIIIIEIGAFSPYVFNNRKLLKEGTYDKTTKEKLYNF